MATAGFVRLLSADKKTCYKATVVILQEVIRRIEGEVVVNITSKHSLCPVWKDGENPLSAISVGKSNEFFINITNPFLQTLCAAANMKQRIKEFNATKLEFSIQDIKILREATFEELSKAKIPCFSKDEDMDKTPAIQIYE